MDYRIGYGEDIHRLVSKRRLVLGGVEIPYDKGLLGHSDADALLHAISDALLGALALGDIGCYFPPNDPSIEGIDSRLILSRCVGMIAERGYRVANVDCCVFAEKPKLQGYGFQMRENIASILKTPVSLVSIKFMTNEGLDAVGQGLAIRATAMALLEKEGD